MEARGAGPVNEWVVEEDARLILLSPPPGAVCERSMSSCRGDGTRLGAMDGVSPPLTPSQGCEQETTSAEDDGAMARGRAPWTEFPLLSLPVRDTSRRRRPPKMTGRRHEAGRQARSFPSSCSQSGMRAGDDVRRDDGATA